MASHPYISGSGNITQMIGFLRKNFPATVTSETVKKYQLAPNNESYVINALQFIKVIDEEGKRTNAGHDVFVLPDGEFEEGFRRLVKDAYADLFELYADEAWSLPKQKLVGYFRTSDKTSDAIGARQASVFQAFAALAGFEQAQVKPANGTKAKSASNASKQVKSKPAKLKEPAPQVVVTAPTSAHAPSKKDMALTVRIEINLPAEGSQETYDNIFRSIRANLLNE
ncbi:DUF5343 domain-containing protein [Rhizobium laguerreae]|uniref:DUF5343 domain-containing protein n=1 Tax=Rhizobium laguerreae TaxID=1076926 RepID=UPI0014786C24|nr:DUF5343 domain-containing protein [Rhizobium laguerreae]NNG70123.1 DUF5343 domain-containing protein [Rhizobium laguerreae]